MAACEPKQNDCEKSGTGPGCSGHPEAGALAKTRCLDEAKRNCEEKLKKCTEKHCIEDNKKKYAREADARKKERERKKKENSDALKKCYEKNKDQVQKLNQIVQYWDKEVSYIMTLLILRKEESQIPTKFLAKDTGAGGGGNITGLKDALGFGLTPKKIKEIRDRFPNPPWDASGQYWNDGAHTFPSYDLSTEQQKIRDEVDPVGLNPPKTGGGLSANLTGGALVDRLMLADGKKADAKKKLDEICPPAKEDPPFDELEEQRRFNQLISRCIADCYKQAVSDCRTVHCNCGLYKCDAGTLKNASRSGAGKSKFPTEGVFDDEITNVNFDITNSSYDLPIELVYTRHFFMGNILWMSNTREERTTTTTKTFEKIQNGIEITGKWLITHNLVINTYLDLQLALCAGEIEGVSRIWLDNNLIYDVSVGGALTVGDTQARLSISISLGSESQRVNETQTEAIGFGLVPAYRDIVYIVFKDMNLNQFKQFPQFKVEVLKRITVDKPQSESAEIADADTAQFWGVDPATQRIFLATTTGLRVLNSQTFETVKDVALDDPVVAVTPLPYVLTALGGNISMFDITFAEQREDVFVAMPETLAGLFYHRGVDANNIGWDLFVGTNTDGDIGFYTTYDTDPFQTTFYPNSWSRADLTTYAYFEDVFLGAVQAYCGQEIVHTDGYSSGAKRVTDMFFAFRGEGAVIRVAKFIHNSTDIFLEDSLIDDDVLETLDIGIPNATSVAVLGAQPCDRDNTIILFLDVDGDSVIIKWHPDDGIIWTATATALPTWGIYTPAQRGQNRYIYYLGTDNLAYRLDTEDGVVATILAGTYPNLGATRRQFYEPTTGSILYFSGDDTFVRLYVVRIEGEVETLTDVIKDIAKRAGLDANLLFLDGISDVNITGYRSGNALIARDVLEPLFNVYPVASYLDIGLNLISKGEVANIVADEDDLGNPFMSKRLSEAFDIKSAALTYYSNDIDGDKATQLFSLPDDIFSGKNEIRETYNVLETDDYMLALAELRVYTVQENDATAEILLPAKYLALTPSDEITINGEWRAPRVEIGADLSIKVMLSRDTAEKYQEILELSGILGFGRFIEELDILPLTFPLVHTSRCVLPSASFSQCTYFGASNLLDEHNLPVQMGESSDEKGSSVGRTPVEFSYPMAWGTLIEAPVNDTRAFSTFRHSTMVVRFDDPLYVELLLDYGFLDSMYRDPLGNMLFVGDEHIRFMKHTTDIDGVTVTFEHLQRARDSTDSMILHEVGETVIVYDNFVMDHLESLPGDNLLFSTKIGSSNAAGYVRRSDVGDNQNALRPLAVGGIVRYDQGPVNPGYAGAKDIVIRYIPRLQNIDAFHENQVIEPGVERTASIAFYDAVGDAFIEIGDDIVVLTDGTVGTLWRADSQQDLLFNNTLSTLTIMITSSSGVSGLTRSIIVDWPPGDYTHRPTRGIVTNVYD